MGHSAERDAGRRTTRHWPDNRCLTCEHGGYTPDTCPVWARHPLKDEADRITPPAEPGADRG